MDNHREDIDLLLSLEDRVLETPPGSPSPAPGYLTDDESPKRRNPSDLSDFKSVVQDCLDYEPKPANKTGKPKGLKNSNDCGVDKFSGLRIRNRLLSPAEMGNRFSEIRFVRLQTIKNLLVGDKLSGCWATIGVLTERGHSRTSSIGQPYAIWKISCLTADTVSLFVFGNAYQKNSEEMVGTVFGLFNCSIRKAKKGREFSLSVCSAGQILKLGDSADYGICNGTACSSVLNKRQGAYCKFHKLKASNALATRRTELKGGNLKTAFRDFRAQGIYTVESSADKSGHKKADQPVRVLTVEALKKALSSAEKVTSNGHSQGIRFLNEMAKSSGSKNVTKELSSEAVKSSTTKRPSSSSTVKAKKKKKEEDEEKSSSEKMMVLDYCSSEEEEEGEDWVEAIMYTT